MITSKGVVIAERLVTVQGRHPGRCYFAMEWPPPIGYGGGCLYIWGLWLPWPPAWMHPGRLTVRSGGADAENPLGTPPGSQSGGGSSAANSQRHINDLGVGAIGRKAGDLTPRVGRGSQRLMISRGLLLMGDTSAGRRQGGSCICKGLLRLRGRVLVG